MGYLNRNSDDMPRTVIAIGGFLGAAVGLAIITWTVMFASMIDPHLPVEERLIKLLVKLTTTASLVPLFVGIGFMVAGTASVFLSFVQEEKPSRRLWVAGVVTGIIGAVIAVAILVFFA